MPCPICEKDMAPQYRPFCSRRCADVDLGRWLNGTYAVPADSPEDMDEASEAMSQAQIWETSKPH